LSGPFYYQKFLVQLFAKSCCFFYRWSDEVKIALPLGAPPHHQTPECRV
jgi:hypothetical protein